MKSFSLAIAIASTVLYHVAQKSTARTINPYFSLLVTYAVAMLLCLILLCSKPSDVQSVSWQQLNWASFASGLAVFGAELGYLLAYRTGWDIQRLSLIANVIVAIGLVPLGVVFFHEGLRPRTLLGIALCVSGLRVLLG